MLDFNDFICVAGILDLANRGLTNIPMKGKSWISKLLAFLNDFVFVHYLIVYSNVHELENTRFICQPLTKFAGWNTMLGQFEELILKSGNVTLTFYTFGSLRIATFLFIFSEPVV